MSQSLLCRDEKHDECRKKYGIHGCGCWCHQKEKVETKVIQPEKELDPIIENANSRACVTCGHISREHNRTKKQADGTWNGKCGVKDCGCKLYVKEKRIE